MCEDEEGLFSDTPPPFIIAGIILNPDKKKEIEKIVCGSKKDNIDVFPNKNGEFVVDLNNLEYGWKNLKSFEMKVIYKKSRREQMKKINLNVLAVAVAKREGKKKQMSIAQIKECIKCTFEELMHKYRYSQIIEMFERYE